MEIKGKFRSFISLADYNYGAKGFEIKFQEEIEAFLKRNGIVRPWWSYYRGSIFEEILEIYVVCKEDAEKGIDDEDYLLLTRLNELYEKIEKEVICRAKEDRVVTNEERKAYAIERHPEFREESDKREGERKL